MAAWQPNQAGAPPGPHLVADNAGSDAQLSRVVELEIIPRLLLMHATPGQGLARSGIHINAAHVATLAELAVDDDGQAAARFSAALVSAGATPRQLLLELLAPCARLMGSWWCDDVFSFSDVTIGLGRLQQLLHSQAAALRPPLAANAPTALFTALPGSQHCFGAALVAECFAQDGWQVQYLPPGDWPAVHLLLARESFEMVGLSISCDAELASSASAIVDLRQASCNPDLRVLVGGPQTRLHADLAQRVGADAQADDADSALALGRRWTTRPG